MGTAAEISTIASYAILSRVAKKVAQYQTRLIIPNSDPIVMAVARKPSASPTSTPAGPISTTTMTSST